MAKKKSLIEELIADITKVHGEGSVMQLGDAEPVPLPVISTGLISLDYAIRHSSPKRRVELGGVPLGRITEFFGPEGGGKSTLLFRIMAEARKLNLAIGIIDAEHSLDMHYAEDLGVDVKSLVVNQPGYGEQGLDILEKFVKSGVFGLVAVDSVAALVPRAMLEGEIGDVQPGAHARLMTQAVQRLTDIVDRGKTAVVFINQLREKIGVFGHQDPVTTTGGRAIKHHASLRLDVKRIGALKDGQEKVGARTKFVVKKNRIDRPFREAEADLMYGEGFSREADLIDFAVTLGLLKKKPGGEYLYDGKTIAVGREKFRNALREDPEMFANLNAQAREMATEVKEAS